jgi:hypothetical protein
MASTDLTKEAALPPGAANVEDDVKAFEAEERRGKLKLMAARIVLAAILLAVWEYGTDCWSMRYGSRVRCALLDISSFGCRTISFRIFSSRCVNVSSAIPSVR